jgi:putative hydrolase of the HAD superfamily
MALKGLIFDFDGLIIDTEMPCFYAWVELFNHYGFPFTMQDYGKIIGTDHSSYNPAKQLSQLTNGLLLPDEINENVLKRTRELIELQPLLPGVLEFLRTIAQLNLPIALASSSKRDWVEGYLSKLKIRQYFAYVCTFNDVKNVKPNPELYLLALKKMELPASETIAFEDSPNGIKAAKAAGIYCIAIPNQITKTLDTTLADKVADSFFDLHFKDLINSFK